MFMIICPNLMRYLQVSEQMVLNDPTGLHLGAGPYFLIYSRAVSDDYIEPRLAWPEGITVCSQTIFTFEIVIH